MTTPGGSRASKPPVGPPSSYNQSFDSTRCRCCPYGFHIHLDFVKFAENVTSGNDHVQKWNTGPRRPAKKPSQSTFELSPPKSVYRGAHSFDASDDWINPDSTMDTTITSASTMGYLTEDEQPTHEFEPLTNGYSHHRGRSDSQVLKLIHELNGLENARRGAVPSPISSSTPYPNISESFLQKNNVGGGWHSGGSASVNAEIQEILSRQQHGYTLPREVSRNMTSAPTSPTPSKSYHLSVARATQRKTSQPQTSVQQQPIFEGAAQPPRRYFDSARPRVLSPEPGARDTNLPASMLRTSNLHSRAYFSPNTPLAGSNGSPSTTEDRVPYRARGASGMTSSLTHGLDFNTFASVRRQRTSTDEAGYRQRTFSPGRGGKLDGYTSDAEYRSARYEMSPPTIGRQYYEYSEAPENERERERADPEQVERLKTDLIVHKVKIVPARSSNQFVNQISIDSESSTEHISQPQVYSESKESQTFAPDIKHIGTDVERPASTTQETQTRNALEEDGVHASTDTEDLVTEHVLQLQQLKTELAEIKTSVKSPPPSSDCSIEFQFCLGHESEHLLSPEPPTSSLKVERKDAGTDTQKKAMFSMATNTVQLIMADKACMPMPPPVRPKTAEKGVHVVPEAAATVTSTETQTDDVKIVSFDEDVVPEAAEDVPLKTAETTSTEVQTDDTWIEEEVRRRLAADKAERRSVDKITETEEDSGEFIMITCTKCDQSSLADGHEHYEKIQVLDSQTDADHDPPSQTDSLNDQESGFSNSSTDLEEFERIERAILEEGEDNDKVKTRRPPKKLDMNAVPEPRFRHSMPPDPEYSDHDSCSLDTVSINTMIMVEPLKKTPSPPLVKTIDPSKIEALRKLLTEPRQHFSRDSGAYRSVKAPKARTTDDLDYIASKHPEDLVQTKPSTPSDNSQSALTDVVVLKKMIPLPTSPIPEPVSAKIPRPKISKYSISVEQAATPDEEEEAADKLTPLRSELRSLAAWGNAGGPSRSQAEYRRFAANQNQKLYQEQQDDEIEGEIQNSEASTDSDGTYDLTDDEENSVDFEMTEPLKDALATLNNHLQDAESVATQAVEWANKYVQHEWLKVTTKRKAKAKWVEAFLEALEKEFSTPLMELVVNFSDSNGNTALHYAVSHENYDLVSVLLDSKVCDVDRMNQAGYSPVMLGSLCDVDDETQSTIIQRLFEIGDVNAKSIKHGQTALHLASSHGRVKTTQLLLDCGADVNIQDIDGSTALMCCVEHGHKEITKMLLNSPSIDASLTDCDNQTALSIAIEQKHKPLAVLIYAHLNFTRYQTSEH